MVEMIQGKRGCKVPVLLIKVVESNDLTSGQEGLSSCI